ncbi:MAG: hypothetical protein HYX43_15790 [Burkholderiales bacterium]|nr:hypothetical protein [Burkholderiales bacterium]
MNEETAMDEVTDLIANIEMHRQEIERETGLDASRDYALRRLRQALLVEQEESRLQGPSAARLASTEALAVEIRRVETLASIASRRPTVAPRRDSPAPLRESRRDAQRKSSKPRGRRTMGRQMSR